MKRFPRYNWRAAMCLLCGLWMFCGGKVWAQVAPPLTMSVDSPLSRIAPLSDAPINPNIVRPLSVMARFGSWFPIAVTLNNTGEAVSGRVELRLTSSAGDMGAVSTFVSDVDLPPTRANASGFMVELNVAKPMEAPSLSAVAALKRRLSSSR